MEGAVYGADEKTFYSIHSTMYFDDENLLYSDKVFTKEVLTNAISTLNQAFDKVNELNLSPTEKNKLERKICSIILQAEMMLLAHYSKYFGGTEGREELRKQLCEHMQKVGIVCFSESAKSVGQLLSVDDVEKYLTTDF